MLNTKLYLLFILALFCLQCKPSEKVSATKQATEIDAIKANFDNQVRCWNKGDVDCFMKGYKNSDDIVMISGRGPMRGYDQLTAMYKRSFSPDNMGTLTFDNFNYKRLSHRYYAVVGRFILSYEEADKNRQGWFSLLLEKVGEEWLVISDHTSGTD